MKKFIKYRLPTVEKWLALPKRYHWSLFAICLGAINFPVIWENWQSHQRLQSIEQEMTQQTAELAHQEKLLIALKQHSDRNELSPQLTKRIVALDQQIHGLLSEEIELTEYQWDFSSHPVLQLQLVGRFQELHDFVVALSEQNALAFAQLEMQKTERGQVQSQVILQLKREE